MLRNVPTYISDNDNFLCEIIQYFPIHSTPLYKMSRLRGKVVKDLHLDQEKVKCYAADNV